MKIVFFIVNPPTSSDWSTRCKTQCWQTPWRCRCRIFCCVRLPDQRLQYLWGRIDHLVERTIRYHHCRCRHPFLKWTTIDKGMYEFRMTRFNRLFYLGFSNDTLQIWEIAESGKYKFLSRYSMYFVRNSSLVFGYSSRNSLENITRNLSKTIPAITLKKKTELTLFSCMYLCLCPA